MNRGAGRGDIYLDDRGATTTAYVAVGYYTSGYNGNNGVYRFTMPTSGSLVTCMNGGGRKRRSSSARGRALSTVTRSPGWAARSAATIGAACAAWP